MIKCSNAELRSQRSIVKEMKSTPAGAGGTWIALLIH